MKTTHAQGFCVRTATCPIAGLLAVTHPPRSNPVAVFIFITIIVIYLFIIIYFLLNNLLVVAIIIIINLLFIFIFYHSLPTLIKITYHCDSCSYSNEYTY